MLGPKPPDELESDEPQPSLNLPPCTDWRLVKGTVRNPYAPRSRGWTVEIRDHEGVVQDCLEFGANTQEPSAVARAAANARLAAMAPAMLKVLRAVAAIDLADPSIAIPQMAEFRSYSAAILPLIDGE